jgi:succinoglycan biosynthesis protein ExoM
MRDTKHITVCVCTYKRPELLARLLTRLDKQETNGLFNCSVVVVDNDQNESARQVVERCAKESKIAVRYDVERNQNISAARNRAVRLATGDALALIDDDEFPLASWLQELHKTLSESDVDGVLGPVKPFFETEPPEWVIKGKFCERPSFQSGTAIQNTRHTRTGNVLLRRRVFSTNEPPFDLALGRTGGEDVDFFRRAMRRGCRFVWCDEAPVFESVPLERLQRIFFLRRALLRGVVNARSSSLLSLGALKSLVACICYTTLLPFLLFMPWRHDLFMKYLIKDCDHVGKLLALCRFRVVSERGQLGAA